MEQIIKETTKKLSKGTITLDEANKILLDLFGVIKRCKHPTNGGGEWCVLKNIKGCDGCNHYV